MTMGMEIMEMSSARTRSRNTSEERPQLGGDDDDADTVDGKNRDDRPLWVMASVVFVVFLCAGVTCVVTSYRFSRRDELEDFQAQFSTAAQKVVDTALQQAHHQYGLIENFVGTIESFVNEENYTWPYATFDNFEAWGHDLMAVSGSLQVTVVPLVMKKSKHQWEAYSVQNQGWVAKGHELAREMEYPREKKEGPIDFIPEAIWPSDDTTSYRTLCGPLWQQAPSPTNTSWVNYDVLSDPLFMRAFLTMQETSLPVLSEVTDMALWYPETEKLGSGSHSRSLLLHPIFQGSLAGFLVTVISWQDFFVGLYDMADRDLLLVLHNTCGGSDFMLHYDPHGKAVWDQAGINPEDIKHRDWVLTASSDLWLATGSSDGHLDCRYELRIYPSRHLAQALDSSTKAAIVAGAASFFFVLLILLFLIYAQSVELSRRKKPAAEEDHDSVEGGLRSMEIALDDMEGGILEHSIQSTTIVTTVACAKISGLSAWSSMRQSEEIFSLLETLFGSFDTIASDHGVIRLDSAGDSYVASASLTLHRADHAVVMAQFARKCFGILDTKLAELEGVFGPGTAGLGMQIGLHSGTLTVADMSNVSRRHRVFGESVETAIRAVGIGHSSQLVLSEATAEHLRKAGKEEWVRNSEVVDEHCSSIGQYSSDTKEGTPLHCAEPSRSDDSSVLQQDMLENRRRADNLKSLVEWNTRVLGRLLGNVVAWRSTTETARVFGVHSHYAPSLAPFSTKTSVLEEVREIIQFPHFNVHEEESAQLDGAVLEQLQDFLTILSTMYSDRNPFHGFEHACHAVMAMEHFLSQATKCSDQALSEFLDPLSRFACVFAMMVHAVDHPGVSNSHLDKKRSKLEAEYGQWSAAQQNSINVACDLLMDIQFEDLYLAICSTDEERRRFRQVVVNVVVATDSENQPFRDRRDLNWTAACHTKVEDVLGLSSQAKTGKNLRTTLVIEYLAQVAIFAHMMQHRANCNKWNKRLFDEAYCSWKSGRLCKDPADSWYHEEIARFDAQQALLQKLSQSFALGAEASEYISYLQINREKWVMHGEEMVKSWVQMSEHTDEGNAAKPPVKHNPEKKITDVALTGAPSWMHNQDVVQLDQIRSSPTSQPSEAKKRAACVSPTPTGSSLMSGQASDSYSVSNENQQNDTSIVCKQENSIQETINDNKQQPVTQGFGKRQVQTSASNLLSSSRNGEDDGTTQSIEPTFHPNSIVPAKTTITIASSSTYRKSAFVQDLSAEPSSVSVPILSRGTAVLTPESHDKGRQEEGYSSNQNRPSASRGDSDAEPKQQETCPITRNGSPKLITKVYNESPKCSGMAQKLTNANESTIDTSHAPAFLPGVRQRQPSSIGRSAATTRPTVEMVENKSTATTESVEIPVETEDDLAMRLSSMMMSDFRRPLQSSKNEVQASKADTENPMDEEDSDVRSSNDEISSGEGSQDVSSSEIEKECDDALAQEFMSRFMPGIGQRPQSSVGGAVAATTNSSVKVVESIPSTATPPVQKPDKRNSVPVSQDEPLEVETEDELAMRLSSMMMMSGFRRPLQSSKNEVQASKADTENPMDVEDSDAGSFDDEISGGELSDARSSEDDELSGDEVSSDGIDEDSDDALAQKLMSRFMPGVAQRLPSSISGAAAATSKPAVKLLESSSVAITASVLSRIYQENSVPTSQEDSVDNMNEDELAMRLSSVMPGFRQPVQPSKTVAEVKKDDVDSDVSRKGESPFLTKLMKHSSKDNKVGKITLERIQSLQLANRRKREGELSQLFSSAVQEISDPIPLAEELAKVDGGRWSSSGEDSFCDVTGEESALSVIEEGDVDGSQCVSDDGDASAKGLLGCVEQQQELCRPISAFALSASSSSSSSSSSIQDVCAEGFGNQEASVAASVPVLSSLLPVSFMGQLPPRSDTITLSDRPNGFGSSQDAEDQQHVDLSDEDSCSASSSLFGPSDEDKEEDTSQEYDIDAIDIDDDDDAIEEGVDAARCFPAGVLMATTGQRQGGTHVVEWKKAALTNPVFDQYLPAVVALETESTITAPIKVSNSSLSLDSRSSQGSHYNNKQQQQQQQQPPSTTATTTTTTTMAATATTTTFTNQQLPHE